MPSPVSSDEAGGPGAPTGAGQKILLIDDDPAIAGLIERLVAGFRRGSFVLEHAIDYTSGLSRLLSGDYVLCLLDYHIGDRDGLELLREAKAENCVTPVIVVTGSDASETDLMAMDRGAADFIAKIDLNQRALERAVWYTLTMAENVAQLNRLATHDELTRALNRREFDRRLREEWQRSRRFARTFALVTLDLDDFKGINDTYGHPAGDTVLRHLSGLMSSQLRAADSVGRYGGDEFALLIVESNREQAGQVVSRLLALVAATPCPVPAQNLSLSVGVSAGVAAWPEDAESLEQLMIAADTALYAAKRQRRERGPQTSGG